MDSAPLPRSADRRLIDKLIREISRAEAQAVEHGPREARRLGEVPPVLALRDVADHALAMRPRLLAMLGGHDLKIARPGVGATLSTLRSMVVEQVIDPEASFRTALLDLRHGLEVVKLLRETARREHLFGVIRWCDDWLGVRRTLVARVEAQLAWYVEHEITPVDPEPAVEHVDTTISTDAAADRSEDWHVDRAP
jgi:hypothetical protein